MGLLGNNTGTSLTQIQSWNGTKWSVQPSPGPRGSWLFGVSCTATASCHAVGWADNNTHALTERWNGQAWVRVANPLKDPMLVQLTGVSCVASDWCTAVGLKFDDSVDQNATTLVASWNGKAWSIVPSPNRGTNFNALRAVSCFSRRSCIAVGSSFDGASVITRTLIESWNGKAWSIVPSPNPHPNGLNMLQGVSCVSTTSCVAVGHHSTGTLIEKWNGRVWSAVPNATSGKSTAGLRSVSCASPSSCHAVGYDGNLTLIEAWNGKTWVVQPNPKTGGGYHHLEGVSSLSEISCLAVGDGTAIYSYG